MAKKRSTGRKVRVEFRQNRQVPGRTDDWTRRYQADQEDLADTQRSESVRAKGDLSRRRTVIVNAADAPAVGEALWLQGTVVAVHGLIAFVHDHQGQQWECTVRRILRTLLIEQRSPVTVGDRVSFSDQTKAPGVPAPQADAGAPGASESAAPPSRIGVIERVGPRVTRLSRRERRGREHTIVANADQLLIVASVAEPRLKPHLIDRYIVAGHKGELQPVICFNKADLLTDPQATESEDDAQSTADAPADHAESAAESTDDDEFIEVDDTSPLAVFDELSTLGYRCIWTSAVTGDGLAELRDALRGRITVLSGQSGVGKSSLINALQPGLDLAVQVVSDENEKGRHTTSHARLLPLDFGGFVVDTPGIRTLDLWDIKLGELEMYFVDFAPYIQKCRFGDCSHRYEEGCAVRAALDAGLISARRYASYVKMFREV